MSVGVGVTKIDLSPGRRSPKRGRRKEKAGAEETASSKLADYEVAYPEDDTRMVDNLLRCDSMVMADLPPEFVELRQKTAALQEEEYWVVDDLGDSALQYRMQAAATVAEGAQLRKYRKGGKVEPRKCYVKVVGVTGGAMLMWISGRQRKTEPIVRADAELFESCFRGDCETIERDLCFQVILQKRMLFFCARSEAERGQWVSGINAVVTGAAVVLAAGPNKAGGVLDSPRGGRGPQPSMGASSNGTKSRGNSMFGETSPLGSSKRVDQRVESAAFGAAERTTAAL